MFFQEMVRPEQPREGGSWHQQGTEWSLFRECQELCPDLSRKVCRATNLGSSLPHHMPLSSATWPLDDHFDYAIAGDEKTSKS